MNTEKKVADSYLLEKVVIIICLKALSVGLMHKIYFALPRMITLNRPGVWI